MIKTKTNTIQTQKNEKKNNAQNGKIKTVAGPV
jgi:hypothetical protein